MGADRLTEERLPFVVRGFAAVSALNDIASEMVYPLLPAFIVGALGGTAAMLGALDGASALADSTMRWIAGRFADRRKRGRLVFAGYGLAALVRPLMGLASAGSAVVALRIADRVGKGTRSPPRDAMIVQSVPPGERGRAFGFQRSWDHAGAMLGGLIGWALLTMGGFTPRQVILGSALPGVAMLVVLLATLRRAPPPHGGTPATGASSVAVRSAESFWLPVLALAALLAVRFPETLLLLHLERRGLAVALIPLIWSGLHVVRTAVAYPAGRWVDWMGERGSVATAGALAAVGAFALARATRPAALVASFLLVAAVAALSEPAERTLVARLAPRGTGRAFGRAQSVFGVTALLAGLAFGLLVDRTSTTVALQWSAAASAVAAGGWLVASGAPRRAAMTRPGNKLSPLMN